MGLFSRSNKVYEVTPQKKRSSKVSTSEGITLKTLKEKRSAHSQDLFVSKENVIPTSPFSTLPFSPSSKSLKSTTSTTGTKRTLELQNIKAKYLGWTFCEEKDLNAAIIGKMVNDPIFGSKREEIKIAISSKCMYVSNKHNEIKVVISMTNFLNSTINSIPRGNKMITVLGILASGQDDLARLHTFEIDKKEATKFSNSIKKKVGEFTSNQDKQKSRFQLVPSMVIQARKAVYIGAIYALSPDNNACISATYSILSDKKIHVNEKVVLNLNPEAMIVRDRSNIVSTLALNIEDMRSVELVPTLKRNGKLNILGVITEDVNGMYVCHAFKISEDPYGFAQCLGFAIKSFFTNLWRTKPRFLVDFEEPVNNHSANVAESTDVDELEFYQEMQVKSLRLNGSLSRVSRAQKSSREIARDSCLQEIKVRPLNSYTSISDVGQFY